MAPPVGKLGPVPAGRGIGLWAPRPFLNNTSVSTLMILPFDWGVPFGFPARDMALHTWMWTQQRPSGPPPDLFKLPLPFDWGVPFGPAPLLQTWTFSSRALYAVAQAPFGQDDWPLPQRVVPLLQTWTFSLPVNFLLRLPIGKQVFDLVPRAYPEPATRTWAYTLSRALIAAPPPPLPVLMGQALL